MSNWVGVNLFCRIIFGVGAFRQEPLGEEMVRVASVLVSARVRVSMSAAATVVVMPVTVAVVVAMVIVAVVSMAQFGFGAETDREFPFSSVVFASAWVHEVETQEVAQLDMSEWVSE